MLKISNLSYSISGQTIFERANLTLTDHSRVALIGDNGTGKTTLLRLIIGELQADHGTVQTDGTSAYVRQHTDGAELSGGQITQREIERAIYQSPAPSLLLLDEPTNNLDSNARDWLEHIVRHFDGQVFFASHDRHFIDQVATHIVEIRDHTLRLFSGNYSDYRAVLEQERSEAESKFKKQSVAHKKLLAQLHVATNKQNSTEHSHFDKLTYRHGGLKGTFNAYKRTAQATAGKKINAIKSKVDQLGPMEKPEQRKTYSAYLNSDLSHHKTIVSVREVTKTYGAKLVLDNINLELHTKERLHVVGPNGSGKSTLLRIIAGQLSADSGTVHLAGDLKFGYISQDITGIDLDQTGLQNLLGATTDKSAIYQAASTMDITPADLDKPTSTLSRGQITKLAVIKLLFQPLDLIIIDEPTNHIDLRARENIEQALRQYHGALLVASHDQHFVDTLDITGTIAL
jgi:ATPase subunit of ABC transporter with duplicated ATPase domains